MRSALAPIETLTGEDAPLPHEPIQIETKVLKEPSAATGHTKIPVDGFDLFLAYQCVGDGHSPTACQMVVAHAGIAKHLELSEARAHRHRLMGDRGQRSQRCRYLWSRQPIITVSAMRFRDDEACIEQFRKMTAGCLRRNARNTSKFRGSQRPAAK